MAKMMIEEYRNFYDEDIDIFELKVKDDLNKKKFIVELDKDEIGILPVPIAMSKQIRMSRKY